ncbi:MAG: hypothetical protein D6820_08230 [Lentisphaerae bacterium]|nr:MAG: hypothetical protein D6820_08230 [Lentisphaerota bacterium]
MKFSDPQTLECPYCRHRQSLSLHRFAFVPWPLQYRCEHCQKTVQTAFIERTLALCLWTMKTYGIALFLLSIIGSYIQAGHWYRYGPRYLLGYLLYEGPFFLFGLVVVIFFTSIVLQIVFDLFQRLRSRNHD